MNTLTVIYNALKEQVISNTSIKSFSIDNNQLERIQSPENKELPVSFPSCFLSYDQLDYQDLQNNIQQGTGTIKIKIANWHLDNDEINEGIFDLKAEVIKSLHGYTSNSNLYTTLSRVNEIQDTNHSNINVWEVTFSFSFLDCDFEDETYFETINGLELDVNYVKKLS